MVTPTRIYLEADKGEVLDVLFTQQNIPNPGPGGSQLAAPPNRGGLRARNQAGAGRPLIDHTTETLNLSTRRPTAPGRQTTPLAVPYRTSNPFSQDAAVRRAPVRVSETGLPGQSGRGLGTALPLAYSVASLIDTINPIPCAWLTNEQFFSSIEADQQSAAQRITFANTTEDVSNALGGTCFLMAGAAMVLTFIPPTSLLGAALQPKAAYSCGLALGGLGMRWAGQRTLRNNSIHRARLGTIRNGRPITADDCPTFEQKEEVIRVTESCCFEVQFYPVFTKVPVVGLPDPVDGFRVELLIQSDEDIKVARVDWEGGSISFPFATTRKLLIESFTVTGSELNFDVAAFKFTVSFLAGTKAYRRIYQYSFDNPELVESISTIPESWPTKLGANRPQVVYLFRDIREDGSYGRRTKQIQVPYYQTTQSEVQRPPTYFTGAHQGTLILPDNSSFMVYAENRQRAEQMVDFAKSVIPDGLVEDSQERYGEVVIKNLNPGQFVCVRADYYPTGQKNLRPEWQKRFGPST